MNTIKKANSMKMKLCCLMCWAMLMTAAHLPAQIYTLLHTFTADTIGTNSDGALPEAASLLPEAV
jgi:hypothetical protein